MAISYSTEQPDKRFGFTRQKRLAEFESKTSQKNLTHLDVNIEGQWKPLPVIRVPIDLPKYRLGNGRTRSAQDEYLAQHPEAREDLFTYDVEAVKAQRAQHEILVKLGNVAQLREHFENPSNQQGEALILDEEGFVVNGNRRLATWRSLYHAQPEKYPHFEYIKVVVLPPVSERAIDQLEVKLQLHPELRAKYTWDATANMILDRQQRGGYTEKELSETFSKTPAEIKKLLDMRSYAVEWLKSRDKEKMWSEVSEHENAFEKMVDAREKIKDTGQKMVFSQAAFTMLDNPSQAGGRLYEVIPKLHEHLAPITSKLREKFKVEVPQVDDDAAALLGGGGAPKAGGDIELAKVIAKPENVNDARTIIKEVIAQQQQANKEKEKSKKLLSACQDANTALTQAVNLGLHVDAKKDGVEEQLVEIERKIKRIRDFLSK